MMAQPVPHQTTDKKRVKVYELRNNDWFDRGTGFCTAAFVQIEEGQPKEPRVTVESEDHPNRLLLETKIVKDDGFQKQQDTLIVWTDDGVDMALSFQEADGCALIWKFIDGVQQTFQSVLGGPDDGLSDDLAIDMPATIQLPPAELASLPDMDMAMRQMSQSPNGRDALAKAIMTEDYISKLIPLVDMAEDLESLQDLHRLCNIMKTILLLNDTSIIEHAVSDECVIGVVGALEYDPDFPSHKANHRVWLGSQGRYKEVVRIEDDQIRRKIHQTYRLQYLKDVVLARILDDPTFSVLNSLIFFNQVDIVQHLQSNGGFLHDLFGIFADPTEHQLRKKEAVLFIQQCCAIAKNLQPPARQTLYNNFLSHGLLRVINFGLRNFDVSVRVGATDILVSMIDHDPQMIRHTIYRQIQEKQQPLTDTLIDLLLVEVDLGIKSQVSESLKVLLDPTPQGGPPDPRGEFIVGQARVRAQPTIDPQQESLLAHFYEHSATRLFKPLLDLENRSEMKSDLLNDGVFSYLNDILCFYIRQHQHRSKYFVLQHDLPRQFVQLLYCKEKHLQLVAIRFFRQIVVLQDDFYIKNLAEKHILGPVLDILIQTLPRDNLLCSACLELFALISKDNSKELIKHIVENYREKLITLSYMDTFREILSRYDQTEGFSNNGDPYFIESEDEAGRRPTVTAGGSRAMMEHLVVDQAQEDYWNGPSDDEDESHQPVQDGATNGAGTGKPLVEYNSDEDAEDGVGDSVMAIAPIVGSLSPSDEQGKENQSPIMPTASPPERLSEKRRREEDEEDVLGTLMSHKRRNSSSSVGSNTSSIASGGSGLGGGALLRKKKGSSRDHHLGQGNSNGSPRKIAINISPSSSTAATAIKSAAAAAAAAAEAEAAAAVRADDETASGKSPPTSPGRDE
ncbi:component of IIS longevity pathway SMK-1-domain-containing protein [Apodospora peruviana]|uniref:Component of IIS longevity pathway SMK-1-domain-containing protein n=1 Tax=Apodospora peruviana TaxID=516989 RepID=A0AAE0I4U7_9PEZI|nr:component of IIS longevity pathway SMK-1-domain-containing protein [Apodospora peruviana]